VAFSFFGFEKEGDVFLLLGHFFFSVMHFFIVQNIYQLNELPAMEPWVCY